jgi:hypothetical protein
MAGKVAAICFSAASEVGGGEDVGVGVGVAAGVGADVSTGGGGAGSSSPPPQPSSTTMHSDERAAARNTLRLWFGYFIDKFIKSILLAKSTL